MEKSRLGISIALFSAILYFFGAAGGILVIAAASFYVLFFEDSDILKKIAVKALILTIILSLFASFINILAMLLSPILNTVYNYYLQKRVYDASAPYSPNALYIIIQSLPNVLYIIAKILEVLVPVIFGLRAYKQKDIKIKWIDNILDKHFS